MQPKYQELIKIHIQNVRSVLTGRQFDAASGWSPECCEKPQQLVCFQQQKEEDWRLPALFREAGNILQLQDEDGDQLWEKT